MGEVYKARDPRLGRDVAIKVLPTAFSADPERLHRFEQEARAAAALNHPNILAVYDIGQQEGSPYIVSELLEGETLRERLAPRKDGEALPVRKAVEYAVQIAHGLAAAHDKGITHRDLKPENIFVTNAGRVKILDFGLAKLTQVEPGGPAKAGHYVHGGSVRLQADLSALPTTPPDTLPGVVLGTIGYMAPEQVRGQQADHRSDIFAFGAILYEMLAGQRAFQRETSAETMTAILKEDPADLPVAARHIPSVLTRIVDRCLEKNPAARFKSADDLAFALEASTTHSGETAALSATPARSRRDRLAWSVAGALAVLLLVALPATLYLRPSAPERIVTRLEVVTPATPDASSFALSPDGRQLAFVATSAGAAQLWVRSFDESTARALPGTDGASFPFWAPDGRAIGFFAGGKLKRIDLMGGAPQVLADAAGERGGAWNRDGVILFGLNQQRPLMRVSATGGAAVAMTQLGTGQQSPRWPQFLPDGRRFLYFTIPSGPETRGTYVASLDGGTPTRVVPDDTAAVYYPPDLLLVVRQGVLMAMRFDPIRAVVSGEPISVAQGVGSDAAVGRSAFAASVTGVLAYRSGGVQRRQLVWMDRAGNRIRQVGDVDDSGLSNPELASDGQRVAVGRAAQGNQVNFDIWLFDVARGVASRFTFDPSTDLSPVWSPDGRRIVFASNRNVVYDLFEKLASGTGDEQSVLVTPEPKWPIDWSPDGRTLLYTNGSPKTGSDLWALTLVGDKKAFPVLQTPFDEMDGQFSPDGRWIAYESNESGRIEIYVRPFPTPGGKWQISTVGGSQPRWRPDGKALFYIASDGRLTAAPITVASDGQALQPGAPEALFLPRLASGTLIGGAAYTARPQYAVARDGRFLMNVAVDEGTMPPINIVLNWDAALSKK